MFLFFSSPSVQYTYSSLSPQRTHIFRAPSYSSIPKTHYPLAPSGTGILVSGVVAIKRRRRLPFYCNSYEPGLRYYSAIIPRSRLSQRDIFDQKDFHTSLKFAKKFAYAPSSKSLAIRPGHHHIQAESPRYYYLA